MLLSLIHISWREFINSSAIKDIYLKVDDQGYVTWVKDADPVAFAKLAQAEATKQGSTITADATAIAVSYTHLTSSRYASASTFV